MTLTQIIVLLSTPPVRIVVGMIGSLIEKIGLAGNWPRVIAVGKILEAVADDLPKLISNVKALAKGESPARKARL